MSLLGYKRCPCAHFEKNSKDPNKNVYSQNHYRTNVPYFQEAPLRSQMGSTARSLKTLPAKFSAHYCLISVMFKTNFSSTTKQSTRYITELYYINLHKGPTIRKVMGGGGEFSSRRNFFSLSNSLYEFFSGHSMNIF